MLQLPKIVRILDPAFLAAIRERPCLVCPRPAEAAHLKSRKAGGTDLCAVPLCHHHHFELSHAVGAIGLAEFEDRYDVNLYEEAFYLAVGWLLSGRTALPHGHALVESDPGA